MRFFLTSCAAFCLLAWPVAAQTTSVSDPDSIDRADVATGIFNKACFFNYGQHDKTVAYLDRTFKRHAEDKKQIFLDFAKVKQGDVWIAAFPKGIFAIVVSEDGNCHVLAQKADRDRVHQNIAALAADAKKNLKSTVKPHENTGSATRSSGFEIAGAHGKDDVVVVASTPVVQAPGKPDAIITLAVGAY